MAVFLHAVSVDQQLRSIQYKAVECIAAIDALQDTLRDSALQMVQGIVSAAEKKYRPGGTAIPRLGPKAPVAYVIIDKSKGTASTVLAQHMTSIQQPAPLVDKQQQTDPDIEHVEMEEAVIANEIEITEIPVESESTKEPDAQNQKDENNVQDTTINYEDATFLNDFDDDDPQEETPPNEGNISLVDAIITADEQVITQEKSPKKQGDPSKIFECSLCKKVFHSMYNMKAHIRVHTGEKPYACAHCDKKFGDQSNYRTHLRRHLAKKPYRCEVCNRGFERLYDVRRHKEALHNSEKGPMTCAECNKVFKRLGSYRKHTAICGLEMFRKSPIKKGLVHSGDGHTDEEEDDENAAPIKQEAGETSSDGWKVVETVHAIPRSTPLRYECETCNKYFSSLYNLKTHVRTHTGERPYQCEFCDRTFSDQSNFKLHIKRHKRERPHKCDHCDASFERYYTLRRHKETHLKSTRYKCGHCGEMFDKYSGLGKHMNVHREEVEANSKEGGKKPASVQLKLICSEENEEETQSPVKKRKVTKSRLKFITSDDVAEIKTEKSWNKEEELVGNKNEIGNQTVTVSQQNGSSDGSQNIDNVEELGIMQSVTIVRESKDEQVEQDSSNQQVIDVQEQSVEHVPDMSNIVQQLSDGTIVLQDTNENAAALALAQFSGVGQNVTFSSGEIAQDGQQTIYILAPEEGTAVIQGDDSMSTVTYVVDQDNEHDESETPASS